MKKSALAALYLGCLIIIIAIVSFFLLIYKGGNSGSLIIKLPEGQSVEMQIQKNNVGLLEVFNKIFEDGNTTKVTASLLRDKEFYKIGDPLLIVTIENMDGNSEIAKKYRAMLKDGRGPFQREYHSFYDINDDNIIDAIVRLDYNNATAKGLRELLATLQGPFQEFTDEVLLKVGEVEQGYASVCSGTKFFKNTLAISNESQERTITVKAFHHHSCAYHGHNRGNNGIPIIRINEEDAYNLFGKSELKEHKPGFATVDYSPYSACTAEPKNS